MGQSAYRFWAFGLLKQMVCEGVDIFQKIESGFGSAFIGVRASKSITAVKNCVKKCKFEWKTPSRFDVFWGVLFLKKHCIWKWSNPFDVFHSKWRMLFEHRTFFQAAHRKTTNWYVVFRCVWIGIRRLCQIAFWMKNTEWIGIIWHGWFWWISAKSLLEVENQLQIEWFCDHVFFANSFFWCFHHVFANGFTVFWA